ncbi:tripartite tricarboxylate transporter substrate binding protein [Xylophilus rhododendri]|uniref:Tripartite tricarboxylate transporter substrate binding protein n=1 Tax=Xylophilus rhododendri TaxID=2697032 RepID=A0A857J8B4_9BURK|nr:tripartite tricarboxylate transporter substrate binding protein [Xylophilus rhododendri]QHJ00205.1 tripartite tricarboxylate transporter substrate binding protein [Xylophilus rhododendri]
MTHPILRRTALAAIAATACAAAVPAFAQDSWPNHPIRFIVPFSAGGANDLMARAAAEGAGKRLGQTIIVENKPGGSTSLGAAYVAQQKPDGYTFLISAAGVISNNMIKKSMPYKDADLTPVAMVGLAPSVVLVPPDAPYNNLKEFIAASQKGQGFHWATAGTGSTPHFVSGILETKYGAKLDIVPYKSGSESVTAVLGKQVQATSEASIVALPYIKSGKLKALADTWTARISAYPQLATAQEQGFPDMQIAHWCGVHAPAGTPEAILDKMAAAIDAAMKDAATAEHLKALGIEPIGGTRASFVKFVDEERSRLRTVVKATGMTDE